MIEVDRIPTECRDLTSAQTTEGHQDQRNEKAALPCGVDRCRGGGRADDRDGLFVDLRPVPLFEEAGRVAVDEFPALCLVESRIQDPVHVVDRPGREAAFAITPAAFDCLAVCLADVDRLELGKDRRTEGAANFPLRFRIDPWDNVQNNRASPPGRSSLPGCTSHGCMDRGASPHDSADRALREARRPLNIQAFMALGECTSCDGTGVTGDKSAGSLLQPGFLLPKSLNPRLGRRVFYASWRCFVPGRRRHKTPARRSRFPHRRRHPETGAGY
jgi:hypothetical protein